MNIKLVDLLKEKNLTISFAESCTGGMLASRIVDVSGSSEVFSESIVTYSNAAKEKYLKVPNELLEEFGAVSKEVAVEMAKGIVDISSADIGVSITGIAGPTGGTIDKPVGLVFIAVMYNSIKVYRHVFSGDRTEVRKQTVEAAIRHIIDLVKK